MLYFAVRTKQLLAFFNNPWFKANMSGFVKERENAPSLATNMLAIASGTEVPAARKVSPITVSGASRVSPAGKSWNL